MDLAEQIKTATVEIFSSMLMLEVTPGGTISSEFTLHSSVTGMVGLAGTHKGMLAIHIPDEVAKSVTAHFLGIDVGEVNDDVLDAVGELANMLGGTVKSILSAKGRDIDLSLPTTIYGEEYVFQCSDDHQLIIIPFSVNGEGRFFVEFQLEG